MKLMIDISDVMYSDIQKGIIRKHIDKVFVAIENGTPVSNEGDLISRSELKKAFNKWWGCDDIPATVVEDLIDDAPSVELDESVIQEVLNKRCMTAVTNEYLIALHGQRPQGEWKENKEHAYINDGVCKEWSNFYCSTCDVPSNAPTNYCPNCGAKMKGGDKNECI